MSRMLPTVDDLHASDAFRKIKPIRVAVRVRPVLNEEQGSPTDCLSINPDRPEVTVNCNSNSSCSGPRSYEFDSVFSPEATQENIFDGLDIQELVNAVAAGYHATVLAYGQTGSGKTYTMEGYTYTKGSTRNSMPQPQCGTTPSQQLGLVPRTTQALFHALDQLKDRQFTVKCSFVQIYHEQVLDLLNPAPALMLGKTGQCTKLQLAQASLRMRWGRQRQFYLENMFEVECVTAEQAMDCFENGLQHKVVASSRLNAASSRSHCMFMLRVETYKPESPADVVASNLLLVDLAGSERAAYTSTGSGQLHEESIFINKSLFILRKVITTLADAQKKGEPPTHVPYRDSKLTALLKGSLGGNSITIMIACIAPVHKHCDENLSTLEYASRAKSIKNIVAVNEDPRSKQIRTLRQEIEMLRAQLAVLTVNPINLNEHLQQHHAAAPLHATSNLLPDIVHNERALAVSPSNHAPASLTHKHIAGSSASDTSSGKVDGIGLQLLKSLQLVQQLAASNLVLAQEKEELGARSQAVQLENDDLMQENTQLRNRLSVLEQLVMVEPGTPQANAAAKDAAVQGLGAPGGMLTASTVALIELSELRRENSFLHSKLHQLEQASINLRRSGGYALKSSGLLSAGPSGTISPGGTLVRSLSAGAHGHLPQAIRSPQPNPAKRGSYAEQAGMGLGLGSPYRERKQGRGKEGGGTLAKTMSVDDFRAVVQTVQGRVSASSIGVAEYPRTHTHSISPLAHNSSPPRSSTSPSKDTFPHRPTEDMSPSSTSLAGSTSYMLASEHAQSPDSVYTSSPVRLSAGSLLVSSPHSSASPSSSLVPIKLQDHQDVTQRLTQLMSERNALARKAIGTLF